MAAFAHLHRPLTDLLPLSPSDSSSNWQEHLLRQYLKRSPDTNQLGTLDDPRPWAELGLGDKVRIACLIFAPLIV